MFNEFLTYINQKQLFDTNQRILLTVSGGLDSMAMLHLFVSAKIQIGVAHCNFGLRGQDSEEDEAFVRAFSEKYNVPFYTKKFDTKYFAKKEGISTQMAARQLRYEWFETVRKENNFDFIATAHHQDDHLETILLNLTRGTGIAGLHGILPKNNKIIRPLLCASRAELEQYIQQHQLTWREDSSNLSVDYQRNLIRQQVIPVLKSINPNALGAAVNMANRVLAIEKAFEEENLKLEKEAVAKYPDFVEIFHQKIADTSAEERLFYLLKPYNFQYHQVAVIWEARNGEVGKQFLSETHLLTIDRLKFVITSRTSTEAVEILINASDHEVVFENGRLKLDFFEKHLIENKTTSGYEMLFDADSLIFPLRLRRWQNGDCFVLLG
jgi:tRNA(Ile)-lysidine synthase